VTDLVPVHGGPQGNWRGDWLVNQLPVGMMQDPFLVRFVGLIQQVAGGMLDHLDDLPHLGDVTVTPEPMVRYLGSWIGLEWVEPTLPARTQRELVLGYAHLLQWRGTSKGLRQLLVLITGDADAKVVDSGGVYVFGEAPSTTPHVLMEVAGTGSWATRKTLLQIVKEELPASVTFELRVAGETVTMASLEPS
jgi:phage tail-like protein